MKKILLGLMLFGLTSVAFADEQPLVVAQDLPSNLQEEQKTISVDVVKEDYCKSILSMSKSIMDGRQSGISIERSLELVEKVTKDNSMFNEILKHLVIEAYTEPKFSSEKYKQEQINEFSAKSYISCMKAAGLN